MKPEKQISVQVKIPEELHWRLSVVLAEKDKSWQTLLESFLVSYLKKVSRIKNTTLHS